MALTPTSDVFETWKNQRYVIADSALLDHIGKFVLLTDIKFWADNIDILIEWCKVNGGRVKGMTVEFDNDEQLMLFVLRWS